VVERAGGEGEHHEYLAQGDLIAPPLGAKELGA
jgi:hypothetical protein